MALVVNTGFLMSNKMQIQNAVDSSAYSGAVVQARGLNILSALNQSLEQVHAAYQKGLYSWTAAVLADEGKPEGPAQKMWRMVNESPLRAICSPAYLRKIKCTQSRIVAQFNGPDQNGACSSSFMVSDQQNIVVKEAQAIGEENLRPLEIQNLEVQNFSSWAMNFHQGRKMPGLSVEMKPQSARHLIGAGANAVSNGIVCDIPAQWGLKPDFNKTQYVLSSATTPEKEGLFFPSFFGSGDKTYAIAKAKPLRTDMQALELHSSDWNVRLVPVNASSEDEEVFQKFRRSSEGKSLGFQQVPTKPLLH